MEAKHHTSPWTEEKLSIVAELWKAGNSARKIALALGSPFTRNSILGKLHRHKLNSTSPHAGKKSPSPYRHLPKEERRKALRAAKKLWGKKYRAKKRDLDIKTVKIMATLDQDIPLEQRRLLHELKEHHCRWPVGDPGEEGFFFCGAARHNGYSYCAAHQERATTAVRGAPAMQLRQKRLTFSDRWV